jgi:uncharacterized protein YjbJ (UPF0337 family)
MAWDAIEGKWKQFEGSVREEWARLTDDDLAEIAGKKDRLLGKLQERYGYMEVEAEKAINDWLNRSENAA